MLYITAINLSIGVKASDNLPIAWHRAQEWGMKNIELWWPWDSPIVNKNAILALNSEIRKRGLRLIAMNFWGGDFDRGERGVLHDPTLSKETLKEHCESMKLIAQETGVRKFNLLLGRGGRKVTPIQKRRIEFIARELHHWHEQWAEEVKNTESEPGVQPVVPMLLLEPLSAISDYPLHSLHQAYELRDSLDENLQPHIGILADLYHAAQYEGSAQHGNRYRESGGQELVEPYIRAWEEKRIATPDHIQIADSPGRQAPGTGALPLGEWITRIREAGYEGEIVGEWL